MAEYKNFVQDFPSRCMDLLESFEQQAQAKDREVTLTLLVASAGFVIPFERLKLPGKLEHPVQDRENYPRHSKALEQLMANKFRGSELHPTERSTNWQAGKLKSVRGSPNTWPELWENKILSEEKTVSNVLKSIRNALAHANIFTIGDPIDKIIFVSVNTNLAGNEITGYSFVSTSPEDFSYFLKAWFTFIGRQDLSQHDVSEALQRVA